MVFALHFIGWILLGFIGWGLTLGAFTKRFPEASHLAPAIVALLFGPIGLFVGLISGLLAGFAWRVTPMTTEERYQAFDKRWGPWLDRKYFDNYYN